MKTGMNLLTTILMSVLLGILASSYIPYDPQLVAVVVIPVVLLLRVITIMRY